MSARAYRSAPAADRASRYPVDPAMTFVAGIVWVAALVDVLGVWTHGQAFRGLHALALVALVGLTLALLRVAWERARGVSRRG